MPSRPEESAPDAAAPHAAAPHAVAESRIASEGMEIQAFPAREISENLTRQAETIAAAARQYRTLDALRQAANQLVVHHPLPELFELLLDLLFAAVRAQRGAILLLEGSPPRLELKASRSRSGGPFVSVSRSIAGRVLEERVALLLADAQSHPVFGRSDSVVMGGVRSAICAPLWFANGDREEVVGLVYLDSKGALPAFDQDDLGLVTAIASVAAVKIHHARLLKDSLEGRELQEEIRLAAEVQAHLLPGAPPEMPGWSLGALSRPSQAMGGDYYDWHLRPDRLCLALADVAGKGTAAALLMAAVRALVRARWCDDDLAGAAERISRDVWDNVPRGRYATAFLGQLDPATGRLAFVNAGHPPPAVVRASGRVEWLTLGGLPLGMMESGIYGADEVTLHSGDTLLVFSDGVCEARGPRGDELGASGLVELVRAGAGLEAPSLATAIGQVLEGLSGFGTVDDDRTLLVLRRR